MIAPQSKGRSAVMRQFLPAGFPSKALRLIAAIGAAALFSSFPLHAADGKAPALMPLPRAVSAHAGALPLTGPLVPTWSGCRSNVLDRAQARLQADIRQLTGAIFDPAAPVRLEISCNPGSGALVPDRHEGYRLTVTSDTIRIDADGPAGVLRAFATLRQLVLLKDGTAELARVSIDDAPRFGWRGVMLDVARHFIAVPTLKRQIDAMERVKFNVLHLHLSDNEAFRVESRRYPKLVSVASHGQFYTQAEIREIVAYAADRGILVVPEFDVPGHTRAIIEAYPEIGLRPVKPSAFAGPPDAALNPALPATYRFLDGLIAEMAALFPGPYFHIGGDEVSDAVWADSADVKALMAREKLATKKDVEGYFARRVIAMVRKAGKTAIGWEEVTEAGVPKDTVVQAWQTSNATVAAVSRGHRTIASAGYYLDLLMPADFHYAIDPLDPSAAGFTPEEAERGRKLSPIMAKVLTDALVAKPLPPLTPEQEKLVVGAETALWSELVTDEMVDARLWPRAAALAERFWSPESVRDPADMYRRLAIVQDQLTVSGLSDRANRMRMMLRLAPGQVDPVATLLDIVTPVRNMAHDHRILAALRGRRIVQPLNRLADAAPADSLTARRFAADARQFVNGDTAAAAGLRAQLTVWRDNDARFATVARGNPMLEPALPTSATIAELAAVGLDAMQAIVDDKPLSAATLAKAETLLAQRAKEEAASSKPLFSFIQPQPPADLIIAITPGIRTLVEAARAADRR